MKLDSYYLENKKRPRNEWMRLQHLDNKTFSNGYKI